MRVKISRTVSREYCADARSGQEERPITPPKWREDAAIIEVSSPPRVIASTGVSAEG